MPESYRSAIVGGIIGACATAVVGAGIAALGYAGNFFEGMARSQTVSAVFDNLQIRTHEGGTTNGSDFEAKCEPHEIPIGGSCTIMTGNGALQNEGTTKEGYSCTYSRRADPDGVKARIFAACLGHN
jgi:hypothetical protein